MVGFETKIKELCRQNGKTQKELYAYLGITDAGMRKMYARNSCEVALLEKIADYFSIPVTDFFTVENSPIPTVNNSLVASANVINDGATINRLISLLEEKDKQIGRLLTIVNSITSDKKI